MTSMSMPVLPDCNVCLAPVSLVIDGDGSTREVCTRAGCGIAQKPIAALPSRREVHAQARQVVEQARREGLPPMRCPSCKQGRCHNCHASGCECTDNEHPRRPRVDA